MFNKKKLFFSYLVCQLPCVVFAEGEAVEATTSGGEEMPLVYVLSMLGLVLSVILLFAAAYVFVSLWQIRKRIKRYNSLENDVKALTNEVRSLRAMVSPSDSSDGNDSEKNAKPKVPDIKLADGVNIESRLWLPFIEDFNKLAAATKEPQVTPAIREFIDTHKIRALMCLDHSAKNNGTPAPKFVTADETATGNFWLWALPTDNDRFVVVPNPACDYTENLHFEGGMKETFASNYEQLIAEAGVQTPKIEVKLPSIFKKAEGESNEWIIEQPGLIHLEY